MSFTQRDLVVALVAALLGYLIGRSRGANVPQTGPQPAKSAPPIPAGWNEPGDSTVQIIEVGHKKINVIKEVRSMTGLGLKEAKDLTEAAMPVTVLEGISEATAKRAVAELENAGALASMAQRRGGAR